MVAISGFRTVQHPLIAVAQYDALLQAICKNAASCRWPLFTPDDVLWTSVLMMLLPTDGRSPPPSSLARREDRRQRHGGIGPSDEHGDDGRGDGLCVAIQRFEY
jgi:hypothetical protein